MAPSMPEGTPVQAIATFSSRLDHQRRRSLVPDSKLSWAGPNFEVSFSYYTPEFLVGAS